jgi:hypothetical protein
MRVILTGGREKIEKLYGDNVADYTCQRYRV